HPFLYLAHPFCHESNLCRCPLSNRHHCGGSRWHFIGHFVLWALQAFYSTRLSVSPSLMGNNTVSTLGSSLSFSLYVTKAAVALSDFWTGSTTLPDHSTLSERMTLPGFVLWMTASKKAS